MAKMGKCIQVWKIQTNVGFSTSCPHPSAPFTSCGTPGRAFSLSLHDVAEATANWERHLARER